MTVHDHRDPAPLPGDAEKLQLHAEFGYRFTADALITRLVAEVLAIRAPGERDAA